MAQNYAITIDAPETRDMDDAIWVQRDGDHWLIQVYIADASKAVWAGSAIDRRAHDMVATRYFGDGSLPMLPRDFAEHRLSLWPGEERKVIVVEMRLAPDLTMAGYALATTTVTSQHKLSYDEIPTLLKTPDSPWHDVLNQAMLVSNLLLERRRQQGALALYDLNTGWVTTEEGHLKSERPPSGTSSFKN